MIDTDDEKREIAISKFLVDEIYKRIKPMIASIKYARRMANPYHRKRFRKHPKSRKKA